LEGIGSSQRGAKRKSEFETSKVTKYRIARSGAESEDSDGSSDASGIMEIEEESEFEGFSDTSETPEETPVAIAPSGKYIPPAARKDQPPPLSTQVQDPRLQKQLQGILNRYAICLHLLTLVSLNQICQPSSLKLKIYIVLILEHTLLQL
jgi:hypothetical protein